VVSKQGTGGFVIFYEKRTKYETKLCDIMSLLSQAHTLDDKNNAFVYHVMHFVNKKKFYSSSKHRPKLVSDELFYPEFCRFSFDPLPMSENDNIRHHCQGLMAGATRIKFKNIMEINLNFHTKNVVQQFI